MNAWNFESEPGPVDFARVGDVVLKAGDRVLLRPQGRADILDLALDGKAAMIASIEQDFEGRIYLAVTLDDDPGRDLGLAKQPGHRFFFGVEEVELIQANNANC
jgi:hypothetical protein